MLRLVCKTHQTLPLLVNNVHKVPSIFTRYGITGYNVYVMGEAAHGRYTLVKDKLTAHSKDRPTPNEWLYVNNYDDHREPIALFMQAGRKANLADDIDSLIDEVLDTFQQLLITQVINARKNQSIVNSPILTMRHLLLLKLQLLNKVWH